MTQKTVKTSKKTGKRSVGPAARSSKTAKARETLLGSIVKARRTDTGMGLNDFGKLFDFSGEYIRQVEKGSPNVSILSLQKFAKVLEIDTPTVGQIVMELV